MSKVSKELLQKASVIVLIGLNRDDCLHEEFRLHKTMFFAQHKENCKPFTYRKNIFGQYSDELLGSASELDKARTIDVVTDESQYGGDKSEFHLVNKEIQPIARKLLKEALPSYFDSLKSAHYDYGTLSTKELDEKAHEVPLVKKARWGDILEKCNLPDEVDVDLNEHEIENLQLVLNPSFIDAMGKIASDMETVELDPEVEAAILDA